MAKARKPAAPKPPASVTQLVDKALKTAATKPNAKWSGASGSVLFNTKEANHEAAIAECTKGDAPLLKQVDKGGALTAAGFEKVVTELTAEEAQGVYDRFVAEESEEQGSAARVMANRLAVGARVSFIQDVISRTPLAATELTPLLEEAVVAEKAEQESRIAAAAKRKAAEEAAKKALARAMQLFEERRQNRLEALKREWEAEGERASDLPEHAPSVTPSQPKPGPAPKLKTEVETDFRRYECDRLAAAWRDAWDAKKKEGQECLVDAMWNIRGFRMIGEAGQTVEFNGRHHESEQSVTSGSVRIVRPGWLLKEEDGEYVALKAAVTRT